MHNTPLKKTYFIKLKHLWLNYNLCITNNLTWLEKVTPKYKRTIYAERFEPGKLGNELKSRKLDLRDFTLDFNTYITHKTEAK